MNLINVVETIKRQKPDVKRTLDKVSHIVLHHTAWDKDTSADEIAAVHIKEHGWRSIGYHFLIKKDGTVYQCKNYDQVGTHVAGFNTPSIGIVMNGNFENTVPTQAQIETCEALIRKILEDFGRQLTIIGHKEAPNAATLCPGRNFPLAFFKKIKLEKKKKR